GRLGSDRALGRRSQDAATQGIRPPNGGQEGMMRSPTTRRTRMAHHESPYKRRTPHGPRWVARYTTPDGRRLSAGTYELKRDAQDAIHRAYTQPQEKGTVGEYAPRWLDE